MGKEKEGEPDESVRASRETGKDPECRSRLADPPASYREQGRGLPTGASPSHPEERGLVPVMFAESSVLVDSNLGKLRYLNRPAPPLVVRFNRCAKKKTPVRRIPVRGFQCRAILGGGYSRPIYCECYIPTAHWGHGKQSNTAHRAKHS